MMSLSMQNKTTLALLVYLNNVYVNKVNFFKMMNTPQLNERCINTIERIWISLGMDSTIKVSSNYYIALSHTNHRIKEK